MRVLWISHFVPYPPIGGAPQRSFNLLRRLAVENEVHFFGLSLRGHQAQVQDIAAAEAALAEFCSSVTLLPARFRSATAGKIWSAGWGLLSARAYGQVWLDSARARRIVAELIGRHRPDVLHVDSLMVAGLAPRMPAAPAVLNHHNIESHMMQRRAENAGPAERWYMRREARLLRGYERRTATRFDRHLVVSALDGERLQEILPGARWSVVANGVDTSFFAPQSVSERASEIVFSGRMNWYPNEHAMLRFLSTLWPEVKAAAPQARLTIVGMNPTEKLYRLSADLPDVTITGFVPDVRDLLARAPVYICPMLDGGGTRLKILDALSLAKAIVATPMAVEGIEIHDGEHALVRPFGPDFVLGILALLDSPSLRSRLAQAARSLALSRYDWAAISAAHRTALESAIAGSGSGGLPA